MRGTELRRSGVTHKEDAGDLEQLYKKYAGMVYRRCLRLLGDHARAEEAMQDVFLKTWAAQSDVRNHPSPAAFFYRVATHHALNVIRASKRRPEAADSELITMVADHRTEVHEPSARLYAMQLLQSEPVETRLMVVYHYVDGMTLEELSQEFSMSVSGIRKRLMRFKEQVQQQEKKDAASRR